ncbi:MAG: hypothetical protein R3B13_23040 [Polyangiaceae bacterium]
MTAFILRDILVNRGKGLRMIHTATSQGIYTSTDTTDAPAGWTSLTSLERALANSSALNTWNTNTAYLGATLQFDKAGTYELVPCALAVPYYRVIEGNQTTVLLAVGGQSTTGATLTFVASTKVITRSSGSWLDDGFRIGQRITITGTTSNNWTDQPITNISAANIVLGETSVVDESSASSANVSMAGAIAMALPASSRGTIRGLILDGAGTATLGTDALVDHVVHTAGTLSPNVAGPTLYLFDVLLRRAKISAIHGRNASLRIYGCQLGNFAEVGIWSEGCSESVAADTLIVGGPSTGSHAELGILLEGSLAGSSTRTGDTMTNGGLWRCHNIVIANVDVGVHWNGIAGGAFVNSSCEGSSATSYLFEKSTGITATGNRSNSGTYAKFDESKNVCVQGFCVSTQDLQYVNDSRNCDANVQVESISAFVPIEHVFGSSEWVGYRYANGEWISKSNNAPTDGYWEKGIAVRPLTASSGNPFEWRCTTNGNPNGGTGVFTSMGDVP